MEIVTTQLTMIEILRSKHVLKSEYEDFLEDRHNKYYWSWAQQYPILKDYLHKIVNEGKRSGKFANNLKAQGLTKGIPDYSLPYQTEQFSGFYLEMKRVKNYKKDDEQDSWMEKLRKQNFCAVYAYGCIEAAELTMKYLNDEI